MLIRYQKAYTVALCFFLLLPHTCVNAQQDWQIKSSINLANASYIDSPQLDKQQSKGLKADISSGTYGSTIGFQRTVINLQPTTYQPAQNQDNWLFSIYSHHPSSALQGNLTYKLDTHQVQSSNPQQANIHAFAPQISWTSSQLPFAIELSAADSHYPDMTTVTQYGAAMRWGFNQHQDWLELRSYRIQNSANTPNQLPQQTLGHEVRLTHLSQCTWAGAPKAITIGLERGEKIFHVDMLTQSIYNLPMVNKGGQQITATWAVTPKTELAIQFKQNKYASYFNGQASDFKLNQLSTQATFAW